MLIQKLSYISQVGASVVLYFLIALSVLSIGMIIERWWYFKQRRFDLETASSSTHKQLRARDLDGARKALKTNKSVEAQIVLDALDVFDDGPDSVSEMLAKAIQVRRQRFERGLLFLGTLGNNAPFVGLFGTVLGVVAAFRELGAASANAAASGGMGNVMSGISEALVATAIGILVALPAVVAYNIFQKKGADIEDNARAMGNVILAAMKAKPTRPTEGSGRPRHDGGEPATRASDVGAGTVGAEA